MFRYYDIPAFIMRLAIFLLILSSYPLIHYFCMTTMVKLVFGEEKVARMTELCFGWSIIFCNLLFALFYPNIGTVLSWSGAVCGFVIIYLLPVMVYLAQSKQEIELKLRG